MSTLREMMAALMQNDERSMGYRIVEAGDVSWYPKADWRTPSCVSIGGGFVRLVAIMARKPRTGALRRLVTNVQALGLKPVVVCPIGQDMLAILKHWGWRRTQSLRVTPTGATEYVEEWTP